jgi:hypothetical protein
MLDFIKRVYRVFVLIGFWVFLIGCTIGGGIIGNSMGRSYDMWSGRSSGGGHPILGGFIGLIVGFVIDILIFGFIATILNIDENLERLSFKMNDSNRSSAGGGASSGLNLGNVSPINPVVNTGDTWVCKKCNERNPIASSSCKGCGAYK